MLSEKNVSAGDRMILRSLIKDLEANRKDTAEYLKSDVKELKDQIAALRRRKNEEIIPALKKLRERVTTVNKKKENLAGALNVEDRFNEKNQELVYCDEDLLEDRLKLKAKEEELTDLAEQYKMLWEAKGDIKKESFDAWFEKYHHLITPTTLSNIMDIGLQIDDQRKYVEILGICDDLNYVDSVSRHKHRSLTKKDIEKLYESGKLERIIRLFYGS